MKSFKQHITEAPVLVNLIDKHDDPFSFLAAAMDAIANGTLKLKTRGLANARELIAAWNKKKKRKIKLGEAVDYIAEAIKKPIKLTPKEIRQYTLKFDSKSPVPSSDTGSDDTDAHGEELGYYEYTYRLLYKGKKIGDVEFEDYTGDMFITVDNITSPKLDGTGRGRRGSSTTIKQVLDSVHGFLKSKTFQKWAPRTRHFKPAQDK